MFRSVCSRWPRMCGRAAFFVLLVQFAGVASVAGAQVEADPRPLLNETETAEWNALADAAARRAYQEAFWARLDPTPGTGPNELREIWQQRVERADLHYGEGGRAGHETDRGRVLSVLGLPDEIEARAIDEGPPPVEVWRYTRGAYRGEVRFVRDEQGYTLEAPLSLTARAFVESAEEELRQVLAARFGSDEAPTATPPVLPATTTTGEAVEPPPLDPAESLAPEVRIWMQLVMGGMTRDELTIESDLTAFPAADGTYITLAFELDAAPLEFAVPVVEDPLQSELAGEAEETTAGEETAGEGTEGEEAESEVGEEAAAEIQASIERDAAAGVDLEEVGPVARLKVFGAFLQGEPGSENTIHQFVIPATVPEEDLIDGRTPLLSLGVTLAPGSYRLAWGVLDENSELAVTRDERVEIPDFSTGDLQITEPLLARPPHLEAVEAMSTQAVYRGVRLGDVLVRDQLDRTFARDDVVEVVTVVTGWQADPNQPGRPLLEVEYRILAADEPTSLVRIPTQSLGFHVLGQQIPLAQVNRIEPGGEYRIHIRVRDLVAGTEAERLVPIRIATAAEESDSGS